MSNIEQLRSAIKDILAKGIADAQGERIHVIGECQDCRWWTKRSQCKLADSSQAEAESAITKATAYDTEGYCAWLETAPDFGCVQWEAKT